MKLNLGAGPTRFPGYMSVDITGRADVHHNLAVTPWPFETASADELLASHVLEHFDRLAGVDFLRECARVLVPGGHLHLAVPDMDKFIACRLKGDFSELGGYRWTDLNYFMGGDESEVQLEQRHRYMYCFASLAWTLKDVGFSRVYRRQAPGPLDNLQHAAFSLYVDAVR